MKKFLKEYSILILAFVGLLFVIWSFSFGGLEFLQSHTTINQVSFILVLIVGTVLFLFIRKLVDSIKWWKVSDTWRKDIKIGDDAYLSTTDGSENVEITDIGDEYVVVKFKAHKSRIYKPYNK
jgi:hypothetical protein